MKLLQFKIFQSHQDKIIHGFTLKKEGDFNEKGKRFQESIDRLSVSTGVQNIHTTHQIHTDQVVQVPHEDQKIPEADALITNQKNKTLLIKVADCQGILIYDPRHHAIAAIHSGWKSSCLNIAGKTIERMKTRYKSEPNELLVGIGPSLGPCCAEFSDPKNELPEFTYPFILKNNHVDFWKLTEAQLTNKGVKKENIENVYQCTKCSSNKFYSHRNKDPERMGVFISLKN